MNKVIRIKEQDLIGIIRESVEDVLSEMAYPISFSMEEFKRLRSFRARVEYCERRLQRISSGSSRIVYKIDDEKVLKLAKNRKGIAQNEVEGANDYYLRSIDCLAKVYDIDKDYLWIEMQLARKAKISDFKRICGYDFETIQVWLDYIQTYNRYPKSVPNLYKDLFRSELFNNEYDGSLFADLQDYVCNYNVPVGDLQRLSSWGVVRENGQEKLVVIDYGLSEDVLHNYYM